MSPLIVQIIIIAIQTGVPLLAALGKYLVQLIGKIIEQHAKHTVKSRLAATGTAGASELFTEVIDQMGGETRTRALADALRMPYGQFETAVRGHINAALKA